MDTTKKLIGFGVGLCLFVGIALTTNHSLAANLPQSGTGPRVEPRVMSELQDNGTADYWLDFGSKADLSAAGGMDWSERGWYVYQTLADLADQSQANVKSYLDTAGIQYESFWINNSILVKNSDLATLNQLTGFREITEIRSTQILTISDTGTTGAPENEINANAQPNISHVQAPTVWGMGYTGQGMVVASIDTGVRYTHQALVNQYRGNLGSGSYNNNYNWYDPTTDGTLSPTDTNGHGTHTMGIMVGNNGSSQIGMAIGAKWIACRACTTNTCTDLALLACGQFMVAPTDLSGNNPDPSQRPNVVNNSWGDCSTSYDSWYQGAVNAWIAAGIYPVFSNGNSSNCSYSSPPGLNTVGNPARYGNVTGVGASGQSDGQYATFSNWGPTDNLDTVNPHSGYADLKPQVIAPGTYILSSYDTSDSTYASMSGTSMAAPHVAGLVALMWSAAPCLKGNYANTETIIEYTATRVSYSDGVHPANSSPNYATGWGEINALSAVNSALIYCGDASFIYLPLVIH